MAKAAAGAKKKGKEVSLVLKDGVTEANPDSLRRALEVYGVEAPEGASTAELLTLVRGHLEEYLKKQGHVCDEECAKPDNTTCPKLSCSKCKEWATEDTPFCPFCGDEGTDTAPVQASSEEEEAETEVTAASADEPSEEVEELSAEASDGAESSAELAEAGVSPIESYEAAVERIRGHLRDMALHGYDLGMELRSIHEQELWKAKGFKSFADFAENSGTGVKKSLAYDLMDITEKFSREEFLAAGPTNLRLIATIEDPEKRKEVLEEARAGASTREVSRSVNEAKGKPAKPPPAESPRRPEPPAPSTPAKAPAKDNTITLLTKVGGKAVSHPFTSEKGHQLKHFALDKGAYVDVPLSEDVVLQVAPKIDKKAWEELEPKARRAVEEALQGLTVKFVRVVNG